MGLNLNQLRHLLALDRHRNFARAAEELGLTQPALTRSLQMLERIIGARLFDRDRSHVEPTAVGARLIAHARPLLDQAHEVEQDIRQLLGVEVGCCGSVPERSRPRSRWGPQWGVCCDATRISSSTCRSATGR